MHLQVGMTCPFVGLMLFDWWVPDDISLYVYLFTINENCLLETKHKQCIPIFKNILHVYPLMWVLPYITQNSTWWLILRLIIKEDYGLWINGILHATMENTSLMRTMNQIDIIPYDSVQLPVIQFTSTCRYEVFVHSNTHYSGVLSLGIIVNQPFHVVWWNQVQANAQACQARL